MDSGIIHLYSILHKGNSVRYKVTPFMFRELFSPVFIIQCGDKRWKRSSIRFYIKYIRGHIRYFWSGGSPLHTHKNRIKYNSEEYSTSYFDSALVACFHIIHHLQLPHKSCLNYGIIYYIIPLLLFSNTVTVLPRHPCHKAMPITLIFTPYELIVPISSYQKWDDVTIIYL